MADDTGIILTFFCEQMENVYLQIPVMSDSIISKITGLLLYVFLPVCCSSLCYRLPLFSLIVCSLDYRYSMSLWQVVDRK